MREVPLTTARIPVETSHAFAIPPPPFLPIVLIDGVALLLTESPSSWPFLSVADDGDWSRLVALRNVLGRARDASGRLGLVLGEVEGVALVD